MKYMEFTEEFDCQSVAFEMPSLSDMQSMVVAWI